MTRHLASLKSSLVTPAGPRLFGTSLCHSDWADKSDCATTPSNPPPPAFGIAHPNPTHPHPTHPHPTHPHPTHPHLAQPPPPSPPAYEDGADLGGVPRRFLVEDLLKSKSRCVSRNRSPRMGFHCFRNHTLGVLVGPGEWMAKTEGFRELVCQKDTYDPWDVRFQNR